MAQLPRPATALDATELEPPMWAAAPTPARGISIFLCAFLPWGLLAPLNLLKLQLNKVRLASA